MSKNTGFMALKITETTREKLSIVNGGAMPEVEETPTYFVFPYDFDAHVEILSEVDFHLNFTFMNTESEDYFVDCEKV